MADPDVSPDPSIVLFFDKNGNAISASELHDVLKSDRPLDQLSARSVLRGDPGRQDYLAAYGLVIEKMLLTAWEKQNDDITAGIFIRLASVRSRLFETPTYANICIAGAITDSMQTFIAAQFMTGRIPSPRALDVCKMDLRVAFERISRASDIEGDGIFWPKPNAFNENDDFVVLESLMRSRSIAIPEDTTIEMWLSLLGEYEKLSPGFTQRTMENLNAASLSFSFALSRDSWRGLSALSSIADRDLEIVREYVGTIIRSGREMTSERRRAAAESIVDRLRSLGYRGVVAQCNPRSEMHPGGRVLWNYFVWGRRWQDRGFDSIGEAILAESIRAKLVER